MYRRGGVSGFTTLVPTRLWALPTESTSLAEPPPLTLPVSSSPPPSLCFIHRGLMVRGKGGGGGTGGGSFRLITTPPPPSSSSPHHTFLEHTLTYTHTHTRTHLIPLLLLLLPHTPLSISLSLSLAHTHWRENLLLPQLSTVGGRASLSLSL